MFWELKVTVGFMLTIHMTDIDLFPEWSVNYLKCIILQWCHLYPNDLQQKPSPRKKEYRGGKGETWYSKHLTIDINKLTRN